MNKKELAREKARIALEKRKKEAENFILTKELEYIEEELKTSYLLLINLVSIEKEFHDRVTNIIAGKCENVEEMNKLGIGVKKQDLSILKKLPKSAVSSMYITYVMLNRLEMFKNCNIQILCEKESIVNLFVKYFTFYFNQAKMHYEKHQKRILAKNPDLILHWKFDKKKKIINVKINEDKRSIIFMVVGDVHKFLNEQKIDVLDDSFKHKKEFLERKLELIKTVLQEKK